MRRYAHLRRLCGLLALVATPLAAQGPSAVLPDSTEQSTAAARVLRLQGELIQRATVTYKARLLDSLPGLTGLVRDIERRVGRDWIGLAPVILVVPDGGRGFECDDRTTCLGRFHGANISVRGSDCALQVQSTLIVLAASALTRRDVIAHELTHALLTQHGMLRESERHDRRYFAEEQFVRVEF